MGVATWGRAAILVVAGGLVAATARVSGASKDRSVGEFVPVRPELTRVIMKSALPLVVDIYWLRAINAIGTMRTEAEHRNLDDFGRVLTTLDPDFEDAYWLIGLSMPYNRGREDWANGDLAVALLERGAARFPEDLRLKLLLGYSLMSFTDRYPDAARTFVEASKLPGAPPFAAPLATRLYLKGDQYENALSLAESMRDSAGSFEERMLFDDRVRELLDEKVLRRMDAAGRQFHDKNGRYPEGLEELISAGLIERPMDARFLALRFDFLGRAVIPGSKGRVKVFQDTGGGRDDNAPETWR